MPPSESEPPAPALRTGPFWSSCGPTDGPIRERDDIPGCIGLHPADPADANIAFKAKWQCGIAYTVGRMADRRGPITVYRLTVGKADVPDRWICVGHHYGWGPALY